MLRGSGIALPEGTRSLRMTPEVMRLDEASQENGDTTIRESNSIASTQQLVDACLAGDRCAMQKLYEQCSDPVYGLMVRMVGRQDADDLTQHVFLTMFRKLDQFNGQSKLETWLYRLATNEALQHLRRNKRRSTAPLVAEPETSDPDRIGASEEAELLETAMSRLEPELRAIVLLKEQRGLSYKEIAEAVGVPEGTVGSRLNRARKELRQELEKLGWC
ncbi:MAG: sigma-70 family RNA polymerase sigma factor [Pirellulaceae bacterium]